MTKRLILSAALLISALSSNLYAIVEEGSHTTPPNTNVITHEHKHEGTHLHMGEIKHVHVHQHDHRHHHGNKIAPAPLAVQ